MVSAIGTCLTFQCILGARKLWLHAQDIVKNIDLDLCTAIIINQSDHSSHIINQSDHSSHISHSSTNDNNDIHHSSASNGCRSFCEDSSGDQWSISNVLSEASESEPIIASMKNPFFGFKGIDASALNASHQSLNGSNQGLNGSNQGLNGSNQGLNGSHHGLNGSNSGLNGSYHGSLVGGSEIKTCLGMHAQLTAQIDKAMKLKGGRSFEQGWRNSRAATAKERVG